MQMLIFSDAETLLYIRIIEQHIAFAKVASNTAELALPNARGRTVFKYDNDRRRGIESWNK